MKWVGMCVYCHDTVKDLILFNYILFSKGEEGILATIDFSGCHLRKNAILQNSNIKDFETETVYPILASRVCTDFAESLQLILNDV